MSQELLNQSFAYSPVMCLIVMLCFYIKTKEKIYGKFITMALIFAVVANHYEKKLFRWIGETYYPSDKTYNKLLYRPNPPRKCGCGFGCQSRVDDIYGLPSGHAQFWGFTSGFWLKHVLKNLRSKNGDSYCHLIALLLMSTLVCYSRIHVGCHSLYQVIFGYTIGFGLGVLV